MMKDKKIKNIKEVKNSKNTIVKIVKTKTEEFKMPIWMDCVWKRNSCGKKSCPVCRSVKKANEEKKNSKKMKEEEKELNSEALLDEMNKDLKKIMREIKKDAKRMGFDVEDIEKLKNPPAPAKFLLYNKTKEWRDLIFSAIKNAVHKQEYWVYTEAFEDLLWYTNLLPVKVYRQLCNKWHLEQGDEYGEYDYKYTKYVLRECSKMIKGSLGTVMSFNAKEKEIFIISAASLMSLEKEIKKI